MVSQLRWRYFGWGVDVLKALVVQWGSANALLVSSV